MFRRNFAVNKSISDTRGQNIHFGTFENRKNGLFPPESSQEKPRVRKLITLKCGGGVEVAIGRHGRYHLGDVSWSSWAFHP